MTTTSTAATATPAAATHASTATHEVAPAEDTCLGCKSEMCKSLKELLLVSLHFLLETSGVSLKLGNSAHLLRLR